MLRRALRPLSLPRPACGKGGCHRSGTPIELYDIKSVRRTAAANLLKSSCRLLKYLSLLRSTPHAQRPATRRPESSAAFDRGGAVGAGRLAARQWRDRPGRRYHLRIRLLQRCAPADLSAHQSAGLARQAGGRHHAGRVAGVGAKARVCGRAALRRRAGAERAQRRQHPDLCADRPRAFGAAQARRGGHRDHRFGVYADGPLGRAVARRSGSQGFRHRGAGRARTDGLPGNPAAADQGRRADRRAVQPRQSLRRHRHRNRIRRSRFQDVRLPARRSGHHRRPAQHGQDRAGAQHVRERRAECRGCPSRYSAWKWARRSSRCG